MSKTTRREFIKSSLVATAAITFSGGILNPLNAFAKKGGAKEEEKEVALPAGEKMVDENDAVAKAIGYHRNVKDIDYTRYPNRKKPEAKNQFCKNCALYTAKNDGWGQCQMLMGKGVVSAQGWCGSWSKKS